MLKDVRLYRYILYLLSAGAGLLYFIAVTRHYVLVHHQPTMLTLTVKHYLTRGPRHRLILHLSIPSIYSMKFDDYLLCYLRVSYTVFHIEVLDSKPNKVTL